MEFNVSKCHVLSVTNKKKPITPTYDLHGHTLEQVHNAKYLGVELTEKMNWTTHVNAISSKANRTSAFIYRNLKGCPTDIQVHCYKALPRPLLEYSSPVCDPHQQNLVNTLEMAQCWSARRICKDFNPYTSATSLDEKLDLQTERKTKLRKVTML